MRLLVGLDGKDGGRDALELVRTLGSLEGGSAVAVTVLYFGPLPMEYAMLPEEEAEEAAPLFEEARERLAGLDVETRAYGGASPAAILSSLAERERFDAIVVGSPHRGPVGRVLIGSVAASLLSGATTAVAVAPHDYAAERHEAPRLVAVAYDGTAEAKLALRRAEAAVRPVNGTVRLLTVATPPIVMPVAGGYVPPAMPNPEKVVNSGLESIDPRLAADSRLLEGDPARALAKACEDGVELLFVGSRGYGPVSRVLLGSISRKLSTQAPCPLLVVPRGDG
jgi:nucleotide-binding universal stress UspA family protein